MAATARKRRARPEPVDPGPVFLSVVVTSGLKDFLRELATQHRRSLSMTVHMLLDAYRQDPERLAGVFTPRSDN